MFKYSGNHSRIFTSLFSKSKAQILFLSLVVLILCGCPIGDDDSSDPRPAVVMQTFTDVTARDFYEGEQGTGYAHVCPGSNRGDGTYSFYIVVNGFSASSVDRQPPSGELEATCDRHTATNPNYHLIMTRWSTGADYIQRNAGFIRALIELVNERYEIINRDRVALVGISMGGVVSRYALQSMETEGIAHNVDLYISLDAPQQGAYVPIGAQYIADVFKDDGAADLLNELNSDASKQLLIYHYTQGENAQTWTDGYQDLFINELQGALGGFLQSNNTRTIAISSGRSDGVIEEPKPGTKYFDGEVVETFPPQTRTEEVPDSVKPFCPDTLTFTINLDVFISIEAWSLGALNGVEGDLVRVASTDVDADVNGININDEDGLVVHFRDAARDQVNSFVYPFCVINNVTVRPAVRRIVKRGKAEAQDEIGKFDDNNFSVPGTLKLSEGYPGGLGDTIGQLREQVESAGDGFRNFLTDPAVANKDTNLFIPISSALMLTGINPTDNMPIDVLEAASPFDKIYIEEDENKGHIDSSTDWFMEEVQALFDST